MDTSARGRQAENTRARSPKRRRIGVSVLTTAAVTLAALAVPLAAAPASAAPSRPATNTVLSGRASKLSARMQEVAQPQVRGLAAPDQSEAVGLPPSGPGSLMTRPGGRLVVRLRLTDLGAATLDAIRGAGVSDLSVSQPDALANGVIAPADLPALVAVPGVASVSEEITPMVGSPSAPLGTTAPAATNVAGGCPSGIVSEGDVQLKADQARTTFSVNGAGVKVGVLSDSYDSLSGAGSDVTGNELPGAGNTCGFTTPVDVQADHSGADEGRAMLQIVHDLAPGSPLAFATAFNGQADMAAQIRGLQTNGASVITDDVTYFDEPMFQDGPIAKAVDDVVAAGATYYSSAANNTLTIGGHDVSSYESGTFRPTPCPAAVNTFENGVSSQCHDFDTGAGTDTGDAITIGANKTVKFALSYSQPQGGVTTDLDLLLVDATTGAVLAAGSNSNVGGTQNPTEYLSFANSSGSPLSARLIVARYAGPGGGDTGTPRFKWVTFTNGSASAITSVQYNVSTGNDIVGSSIIGHNGAARAASVAAVPYSSATTIEPYSSHGPLKKCWAPSPGTITGNVYVGSPGAQINPCQTKTVDFAATDGGANNFFGGFSNGAFRFYGTSAAAPHAAAVGALARQKYPCRTPDEILAAQRSTAVGLAYPVDTAGSGLVDANAMLGALSSCTGPAVTYFHPVDPVRVLDSRPGVGNVGGFTTPWAGGTSRKVAIGGVSGIPSDAVAVVLNVTVTGTTGSSFLTLWPAGTTKPTASSLNWAPGVTIPNAVTVKLGTGGLNAGKVSVFNLSGNADVIIDVAGYYTTVAGDGFTSQAPSRVLDSRPGVGNVGGFTTPWAGGTSRDVAVGGIGLVPVVADAVVLNVTVTGTTGSSFLTLWPAGTTKPTASSLNWVPGTTIPNAVTVKLGTSGVDLGKVSVFNLSGNADVIIDVAGWYQAGTGKAFHPVSPVRVLDSRPGVGNVGDFTTPWTTGTSRAVAIGNVSGIPSDADSVVVNTTVTNTTGSSFLTVWPAGATKPTASSLNWVPGVTIPNAVTVKLGTGGLNAGKVSMFNLSGSVDVITDVAGWFS